MSDKTIQAAEGRSKTSVPARPYQRRSSGRRGYEIVVAGHLDLHWAARLGEMDLTHRSDGNTLLSGKIPDQAALHGILVQIRDLGVPLVSLRRI